MLMAMGSRAWRDAARTVGSRVVLVAALAGACVSQTTIPPGAQQVRLASTSSGVTIAPATVRAGQVFVIVEGPGALFIAKSGGPGESTGFSDADVERIAATGDLFHTSTQDLTSGYAGPVQELGLTPGKYILMPIPTTSAPDVNIDARNELCARDPTACDALPPLPVTVLEVVP
jgi:hypothetical protein